MTEEDGVVVNGDRKNTMDSNQVFFESLQKERLISDVSFEEPSAHVNYPKTQRSESFSVLGAGSHFAIPGFSKATSSIGRRVNRSESLYVAPKISEQLIEKACAKHKRGKVNHGLYLKERGTMRHMIQAGEIDKAQELLKQQLQEAYNGNIQVRGLIDALKFLNLIDQGELEQAITFASDNLNHYMTEKQKVFIPVVSKGSEKQQRMNIIDLTALFCYQDPHSSELGYLLSDQQKLQIIDCLNNELISK